MTTPAEAFEALQRITGLAVSRDVPLSRYTRFAIGGPAAVFAETDREQPFLGGLTLARSMGVPTVVLGGGTNLVVSDAGFAGVAMRYTGSRIAADGATVTAQAGADLQALVDFAVDQGLEGLETLAGIPGSVGGAIYGNAGAYGHSISERVVRVRFFDGGAVAELDNRACQFHYRESIFKRNRDWIVLEAGLALTPGARQELRATADRILRERSEKFPLDIKCAGSIFKNLLVAELPDEVAARVPADVVREGKVPAAWFLDAADAKGLARGDLRVAPYHANVVYNAGSGSARELRELIAELKARVQARFGLELEEEVQYIGEP